MTSKRNRGGRPSVFTEDVLQKLEAAFRVGSSVESACIYAEISERAFYYKLDKDEGFLQRIRRAQNFAIMMLHKTIYRAINDGDAWLAWKVLQAKRPDKYGKDVLPCSVIEEFEDELGVPRGSLQLKLESAR